MWYRIELPYACGGIEVDDYASLTVIAAPPIFYWMIGKDMVTIAKWVGRKGGTIVQMVD